MAAPNSHTSKQHPAGDDQKRAILPAQRQKSDQAGADGGDADHGAAGKARGEARIDDGQNHEGELGGDPAPEQRLDPAMPQPDAKEAVEEEHEARSHSSLGSGAIDRNMLGIDREQLAPISEVDAEIGEHRPGDERGCREDGPVIGGEDRGQENGEEPGDAEQHAVEQHAVLLLRLVDFGIPQHEARHLPRGHLRGEGHGLPRLEAQAEHVGAVALHALWPEAERRRDGGDAAGVELGRGDARIGERVAWRDEPARDALVGRIGEREDEPAGIGAGGRRLHRHAADIAVAAGCGLELKAVAAALIELAERRDVDLLLLRLDDDGVDGVRRRPKRGNKACAKGEESHGETRQSAVPAFCRLILTRAAHSRHHAVFQWRPYRLLTETVAFKQRVKQMILPHAVDLQIAARHPLAGEASPLQELDGGDIGGQARSLEPVQLERIEYERDNSADGRCHIPLPGMLGADPIAEGTGLGHPAAHIAQRQAADERAARRREDEQRVAHVLAEVAHIVADAAAEGGAGQLVGSPNRLPGREKIVARGAQLRPVGIVGHLRGAQQHPVRLDDRAEIARGGGTQQRHSFNVPHAAWLGARVNFAARLSNLAT